MTGLLQCSCPGYQYHHGSCKHVEGLFCGKLMLVRGGKAPTLSFFKAASPADLKAIVRLPGLPRLWIDRGSGSGTTDPPQSDLDSALRQHFWGFREYAKQPAPEPYMLRATFDVGAYPALTSREF